MSETNSHIREQALPDDEISLKEVIIKLQEWRRYLFSRWKTILLAGIIGGLLGLAYSFIKKPVYTAETTFVLEEESKGGLGAYAGLASMVGIDLGGGSNGIFQGDNIIELYKSRTMIEKTLLTPADFEGRKELLINRFIESNELRDDWKDKPKLADIQFTIPKEKYTLQHDSIIGEIVKDLNENYLTIEKPDKKLSIISVKVKGKDELFAKAFADKIVENVNEFYVQTKTKKSAENVQILQKQADSVRRVLNAAIGGTAAAIDANPNANPAMATLRVPSQRRQVDVQASAAVYQEVVKNLEIAKISLRKETPLIQVIDEPILPLKKDKVGKAKGLVLGGIIAGFLTVMFLLAGRIYRNILDE